MGEGTAGGGERQGRGQRALGAADAVSLARLPLAVAFVATDSSDVRLPVLVVARAGLGTVNHTALTVEALRRRGLAVAGIVLNRTSAADDPSVPHNAGEIAHLTGITPAAVLPFVADIEVRPSVLRSTLAGKINF